MKILCQVHNDWKKITINKKGKLLTRSGSNSVRRSWLQCLTTYKIEKKTIISRLFRSNKRERNLYQNGCIVLNKKKKNFCKNNLSHGMDGTGLSHCNEISMEVFRYYSYAYFI